MQHTYGWILSSENLQESRKDMESTQPSMHMKNPQYPIQTSFISPNVPNTQPVPAFKEFAKVISNDVPVPTQPIQGIAVESPIRIDIPVIETREPTVEASTDVHQSEVITVLPPAMLDLPTLQPTTSVDESVTSPAGETHVSHFYHYNEHEPEPENPNFFVDPETDEHWIRCQNPFCGKWRFLPMEESIPQGLWFCVMNTWDEAIASCSYPQLHDAVMVNPKRHEEEEKSWMPQFESHFERITSVNYCIVC